MSSADLQDLLVAARSGDLETVRRLVREEGMYVNLRCRSNFTILHIAAKRVHSEVVQFLLDSHANVNARGGDYGDRALHSACSRRRNIRVIRLLIDHKADINRRRDDGMTALHCAILFGADLENVRCLLDYNADVNITDIFGRSPLHLMGQSGTLPPHIADGSVMELLLSHNVDLEAKDEDQKTPLHALVENNCIEAVRVLLDHLSSSNDPASIAAALMCRTKTGCLPFHSVRNPEMAKLLLEQPALQDNDQVVPRVCHEMFFAEDSSGQSLLDRQQGEGPLFDYLASFTNLPLTVLERRRTTISVPCEHRHKRPRRHATAPFHPNLNEFQRSVAKAFLNKWDQSFRQRRRQVATGTNHQEDMYAMLPDDLKYVIMAYLSTVDIVKI